VTPKKPRKPLNQSPTVAETDTLAKAFVYGDRVEETPKLDSGKLPLKDLEPALQQPRRYFDVEKINRLVESIREHGILEPLIVRPRKNGKYEIVAGERRYKAALILGLSDVPVVIREFNDQEALQVALIENLQREDLNPVEETESILELLALKISGGTQDVISILHKTNHAKNRGQELEENVFLQLQTIESVFKEIGRFSAESFRTSRLPLLNLPEEVLIALRQGKIEFTKARAIARVKNETQRNELLNTAIIENLSLSQIRERVAALTEKSSPSDSLKTRFINTYKEIKNSEIWNDPQKQKDLEKILESLEKLAGK